MGQLSGERLLRINGADLIFSVSVIDNSGNAVVASQTVKISVQRLSDDKFWTGAAWATGAEPALISAVLVGTTGIYEYTLTGGFDLSSVDYRVHIEALNTVAFDYYQDTQLNLAQHLISIKTVTDILNSVDGVGLEDREEFLLAYIKGKVVRTGNSLEYKKQNGTTKAFTLTGTSGLRTPT